MGKILCLFWCLILLASQVAGAAARAQTLILGLVSDNPKKEVPTMMPMLEYVVSRMGEAGIVAGDVLVVKEKDDMVKAILEGRVDWITDTPFPCIYFQQKAGAEMLVRRWKKGVGEYHTLFVTHKESGVKTLQDLPGRKIVFQDKDSSTTYFVPMAILRQNGFSMVELPSARETVPGDKVGYVFGREDTFNQVAWLNRQAVEAAAVSNLDWQDIPAEDRANLTIFHESKPFPRGLEMVRQDLPDRIKTRLKQVLLQAHEDPAATEALKSYVKTRKFDEIDSTVAAELDYARQLMKINQDL